MDSSSSFTGRFIALARCRRAGGMKVHGLVRDELWAAIASRCAGSSTSYRLGCTGVTCPP